jgi:hypothetical protein
LWWVSWCAARIASDRAAAGAGDRKRSCSASPGASGSVCFLGRFVGILRPPVLRYGCNQRARLFVRAPIHIASNESHHHECREIRARMLRMAGVSMNTMTLFPSFGLLTKVVVWKGRIALQWLERCSRLTWPPPALP